MTCEIIQKNHGCFPQCVLVQSGPVGRYLCKGHTEPLQIFAGICSSNNSVLTGGVEVIQNTASMIFSSSSSPTFQANTPQVLDNLFYGAFFNRIFSYPFVGYITAAVPNQLNRVVDVSVPRGRPS